MRILIVDDHAPARKTVMRCLASLTDSEIYEAASLSAAREILEKHLVDVALIDLRLDARDAMNRDGLTLVRELRDGGTAVPIVVTASSEMSEIRKAMRVGAYAYILKDELCEELVLPVLTELQGHRSLQSEVLHLYGLVGTSRSMERVRRQIKKVAAVNAPVLVLGPTGSGKELVAQAIHALSPRRDQPLVTVNCGALAETLVESQLFGHEKGAFTGADKRRDGYLSEAGPGTLFLDEIAELPAEMQTKLLRVLENRVYRALGAASESKFEGRIIAATHVDLTERIAESRFREDLYYRLEVLTVRVPSLDERQEDIPALAEHFAKETPRRLRFSDEALAALRKFDWPGNVRQLRNFIHRLSVFTERGLITEPDIERNRESTKREPKGARTVGEELLRGLSPRHTRDANTSKLAQNQIRVLEGDGVGAEEICRIMSISRATLFRLKSGDG